MLGRCYLTWQIKWPSSPCCPCFPIQAFSTCETLPRDVVWSHPGDLGPPNHTADSYNVKLCTNLEGIILSDYNLNRHILPQQTTLAIRSWGSMYSFREMQCQAFSVYSRNDVVLTFWHSLSEDSLLWRPKLMFQALFHTGPFQKYVMSLTRGVECADAC